MFHSTSHGNSRKSRKIERIKHKLVDMLREQFSHTQHVFGWLIIVHTGEIGFMLPKDRLPWSTLEGDLQKKGYTMLNWPKDVARDKDKGVSGLSAEDTNKLYNALFRDERRLKFIRCGEGKPSCIHSLLCSTRFQHLQNATIGPIHQLMHRVKTDLVGAISPLSRQQAINRGSE